MFCTWYYCLYYHYYEYPDPHRVSPHFGIRTPKYKLIRFYGAENGWEFYDLKRDPSEMNNAINVKKYGKVITELKSKLATLIDKYEDDEAKKILNDEN